jgi:hypothetical protein
MFVFLHGLFHNSVSTYAVQRQYVDWLDEKDLERYGSDLISVLSWHLPGATEEYHKKHKS